MFVLLLFLSYIISWPLCYWSLYPTASLASLDQIQMEISKAGASKKSES